MDSKKQSNKDKRTLNQCRCMKGEAGKEKTGKKLFKMNSTDANDPETLMV